LEGRIVSPTTPVAAKAASIKLAVRKGSIVAPIILLIVTILLFIAYGLPAGVDQLGESLGITRTATEPLTFDKLKAALETEATRKALWSKVTSISGFGEFADKIVRPAVKIYLDQLLTDFATIARSCITTILQLSLFSLLPGIAGLIYRRRFALWFLVSFVVLFAINSSGWFGSLTSAQPMPGSGAFFFFIFGQVVLLALAYRLRRHAKSLNLLPPKVHNWALTGLLTFIGFACWQGWGPGHVVGTTQTATPATVAAKSPPATTTAPAVSDAGAGAPTAPVVAAGGTVAGQPEQPPIKTAATAAAARPSWIWGFLGAGLSGWIYKWEFILLGLPLIYSLLRNSAAWTARAPKNIVVCLDGTSNTPDQMEMGFLAQTNVFKLFKMLKADKASMFVPLGQFDASLCKRYGEKQIGLYYAGVGNKYDSDPILQTLGMATGKGAADIVERAYLDLVRVYQPGDRIFIFGFSRGSAIARLLARTIDARGAPRSIWTLRLFGKHRTLWTSARKQPMPIDVLGCWDTVGSFGVAKTIAGINLQQLNLFKDLTIPDNVGQAYHLVALDESRAEFEPTLMDPDPIRPERIVEVWFSGDHANIGGGWATDKLSDITLDFLLSRISSGYARDVSMLPGDEHWGMYLTAMRAKKVDLTSEATSDGVLIVDPDPLGQVRHWFSNLYNYRPRKLPLHAVISDTVFERMKTSIPVYAPQSLFDLNDALDAKRDMIETKVGKLTETGSLDETERQAMLDFKDRLRLTRWPQYWASVVAARAPRHVELVLANAIHGTAAPKS
jgi:Uncharacterized alpha/beta hydrolase domain (DUF2235)